MSRHVRRFFCALLLAALLVPASGPALAKSVKARVSASSARVYSSASTSSKSMKVKKGLTLTVVGVKGSWAKVKYKGRTGYCPVKYLSSAGGSKSAKKVSRKAGYISRRTYIYKKASTSSSRKTLSVNTKVYVVGSSGSFYKVQNSSGSMTGYVKKGCVSKSRVSTRKSGTGSMKSRVVKMNWYQGGSEVLGVDSYGYIYDIRTGITMRIKRMGGHNHMDVEPATKADTAKLKRIAGGSFSWDSHAVILLAGGKCVAAAINTMPHGDQTISGNGYDGQFCLHLSGSLTHGSGQTNQSHQSAINAAYNWAH